MTSSDTLFDGAITGLILAGGRGTRMGSVDKGLQPFRGMPMALHVLHRLQPQVDAMLVNANQNLAAYESFGVPVWPDALSGFAGPLAGLQTGLMHCETPYLVTAPCDSPLLPADLVMRLAAGLHAAQADVALAVTGAGAGLQPHPVFCLIKTSVLPSLSAYLQDGGRKVDAWFATLDMTRVHFDDDSAFRNINTLDELQQFDVRADVQALPRP
ncbi:MAG: molybdenum cofactor guanylyltransferase MobA [Herminiimonas sp.]|nr:molybdenum cofactor guanylyltransferase MobA [Herminiimonas sp.]